MPRFRMQQYSLGGFSPLLGGKYNRIFAIQFHRYTILDHRPITSYGALDLPTYFLDLTPFVPVLTDGNPHNFTLDVASAETDHAINGNWFVSGLLQVITDSSSKPTTGNITSYSAEPYATTRTTGSVSANGDVIIIVDASRQIHIEAEILSGSGHRTNAAWSQKLEFSNTQFYLKNTTIQVCHPGVDFHLRSWL